MAPNRKERRTADSIARKQKNRTSGDAEPVGNYAWDELHQLYQRALAVALLPGQVLQLFQNKNNLEDLNKEDSQKLVTSMGQLKDQVAVFNEQLTTIRAKHEDKTGSPDTGDELIQTITIGNEYSDWLERYYAEVVPHIETVTNIFEGIEGKTDSVKAIEGELLRAKQH